MLFGSLIVVDLRWALQPFFVEDVFKPDSGWIEQILWTDLQRQECKKES